MVYGGLAIGEERIATPYAVLPSAAARLMRLSQTRHALAKPHRGVAGSGCGDYPHGNPGAQSNSVDLDKARLVVSVGRGMAAKRTLRWQNSFVRR